jgi:stage II sporulation protein M
MAELILNSPPLAGIVLLFLNNLFASMYIVLLGVILGLPPLLGLFTNGAFLGTVITNLGLSGINALAFFSLGVLPHGVFELTAFFLSAAFGLKLGFHAIFPLPQKKRGESIVFIWKEFWTVLPLILILLVIAAAIEILVTPHLLNLFGFPAV